MKDKVIIDMLIDDLDESGIELISVVDRPAIEVGFIRLSEETQPMKLASDKAKQYVTGPVLIPEQEIYRREGEKEYYIRFSAETIEKIRNKFFLKGQTKLSNLDHSSDDQIEGYLIESWLVVDPEKDKSLSLGFEGVKAGTLFCTYHFPDQTTWEAVSQRNGFSIEGFFKTAQAKLSEVKPDTIESLLEELANILGNEYE